jgi:HK97 family phage major capsid protein
MLTALRSQLRALLEQRAVHQRSMDDAIAAATAEERTDLTDAEAATVAEARDAIDAIDAQVTDLQARIADLEDLEARNRAAADAAARLGDVPGVQHTRVAVTGEPSVYNPDDARRGVSFFRDLVNRAHDIAADERLRRHAAETRDLMEQRDVGTGAFTGLVVPQYLTDLVAPKLRAGRPVADICNRHPLPESGMTVNISRITTGTAAAVQASENASVQETDIDDTLLTVNVRTVAGAQDVSRQAIERGVGVDEIVLGDLVSAYNTELDRGILNDNGGSGTHLGIRSTSGIVSVTYTDSTPTPAELFPKLGDLIQQVQSGVYVGITHWVMHPRRWWWLAVTLGSTFPLLTVPMTGSQQAGQVGGTDYRDTNRQLLGVPVVLDANVPTNLGAGTNEDVIIGVTADELHLWEDPAAPLFIRAEEVGAGSLTVKLVVYGYSAFTAGRYPGAHGTISGTGLVTPTF